MCPPERDKWIFYCLSWTKYELGMRNAGELGFNDFSSNADQTYVWLFYGKFIYMVVLFFYILLFFLSALLYSSNLVSVCISKAQ